MNWAIQLSCTGFDFVWFGDLKKDWISLVLLGSNSWGVWLRGETVRCFIWAGSQSFSSPLPSEASSVWKWLRDVWWDEEETPFTAALLSLWEFIIHTQTGHTHAHGQTCMHTHKNTDTYSFISTYCMRNKHTCCIYTQSLKWTLVGRCAHHSPHYKLTIMNMFLWTSFAPPMQTDSPTIFYPQSLHPQGVGVYMLGARDAADVYETEQLVFKWYPQWYNSEVKPHREVTRSGLSHTHVPLHLYRTSLSIQNAKWFHWLFSVCFCTCSQAQASNKKI